MKKIKKEYEVWFSTNDNSFSERIFIDANNKKEALDIAKKRLFKIINITIEDIPNGDMD